MAMAGNKKLHLQRQPNMGAILKKAYQYRYSSTHIDPVLSKIGL